MRVRIRIALSLIRDRAASPGLLARQFFSKSNTVLVGTVLR